MEVRHFVCRYIYICKFIDKGLYKYVYWVGIKMILLVMNYGNYCFGPLKWFKVKSNVLNYFLRLRYF